MKSRSIFYHLITTFIVITLTSCSILPMGNNDDISDDDLLGEWEFISSENGSADLAYNIEFLSNGTLCITEDADLLVEEYQYAVTRPGRMNLSALGVEQEVKYEIKGDQLWLKFDHGDNVYSWKGSTYLTQPTNPTRDFVQTPMVIDTPIEVDTPKYGENGQEIITPKNADRVVELYRFGKRGYINQVAWTTDGEQIAVSTTSSFYLVDNDTLTQNLSINMKLSQENYSLSSAFSTDGKILASVLADRTIQLWDISNGVLLQILKGDNYYVNCVTFSPDGSTLVSGGMDGRIFIWDVASGLQLSIIEGHNNPVLNVAFSPDGAT